MKKKLACLAIFGCTQMLMTGGVGAEEAVSEALIEETETEESVSFSDPLSLLVENAADYITMPDLETLELDKYVTTITDEDVESELSTRQYDYAEYVEADDGAEDDDYITLNYTAVIDGDEDNTEEVEDYEYTLGYGTLGYDFDDALYGCVAGDEMDIEVSYTDDDYVDDAWIDHTVSFHVEVTSVVRTTIPELTEEYVTESLGYESMDAYKAEVEQELQESADQEAAETTSSQAIETLMEASEFAGYPEDLFNDIREETVEMYAVYAEWFGMTEEELYEYFELDDDAIDEEALSSVQHRIAVSAVIQEMGLSLTEEDIDATAEAQYAAYGYEDAESFKEEFGSDLVYLAAEQIASDYLLSVAQVTEASLDDYMDDDAYEEIETEEGYDGLYDDWYEIETESLSE